MPRSSRRRSPALARHLQVVHAAGIGGGLPGRACAPNSCRARSAAARRRATSGESRVATPSASNAAERKPRAQERMLVDGEPVREQLRAGAVEQETRAPVQRAARHRAEQVPDQRTRDFGREQHRHLAGRQLPRLQPRERALARRSRPIADARIPGRPAPSAVLYQPSRCIASPRPAISAQPMRVVGAALAADEAVRIGVHAQRLRRCRPRRHRNCSMRASASRPACFAGQREVDRARRHRAPTDARRRVGNSRGSRRHQCRRRRGPAAGSSSV